MTLGDPGELPHGEVVMESSWQLIVWFVARVTRHPVCSLVAIVVALPVLNFGRPLGIPLLFWHEDPAARRRAGAGVTLVFATLALVVHLLESDREPCRPLLASVAATGIPWALLVLGAALYRGFRLLESSGGRRRAPANRGLTPMVREASDQGETLRSTHVDPGPFAVGALLAAVAVTAVAMLFDALPGWWTPPPGIHVFLLLREPPANVWLHLLALGLVASVALAFVRFRADATPAVAICLLLAAVAAIDGFLTFRTGHPATSLGLGAVLLLLGGRPRYKMSVPAWRARYARPAPYPPQCDASPAAELLDLREPIAAGDAPGPLVLLCASGGGLRAAVWAAAILQQLDRLPGFRRHARLVTGASGGMVGAAFWVAGLHAAGGGAPSGDLVARVSRDALTAVARRMAFRDVPLAFLPVANPHNRGQALEDAWREHDGAALGVTFAELREGERSGRWPSLVFSPTVVEDGRRLLIGNVDLRAPSRNRVRRTDDPTTRSLASTSAYHLAELLPDALGALSLGTAARLSASFPYVSPAAVLPTEPRRRVVDAGYFDNYGVSLACGFLRESLDQEWFARCVSRVLLIQIRDNVSPLSATPDRARGDAWRADGGRRRRLPEGVVLQRGFEELSSPIEAFLATRESVMLFRNDADLEALTSLCDQHRVGFLTTTVFELRGQISLSWYLSQVEIDAIRSEAESIRWKLEQVRTWLEG